MKFTLKTFAGDKLLETFQQRSASKIREILRQTRFHWDDSIPKQWDDYTEYPNNYELFNSYNEKIFKGGIDGLEEFVRKLK